MRKEKEKEKEINGLGPVLKPIEILFTLVGGCRAKTWRALSSNICAPRHVHRAKNKLKNK
jgi:hypothetical protein